MTELIQDFPTEKQDGFSEISDNRVKLPFFVTESYKQIRTNLVFSLSQLPHHSFVFSSFEAGDGKSTTSLNIARAFALFGDRVLLIDADMRKPTLYRKLRISNSKGLSSVLVGFCTADAAIQSVGKNFDVMTSGPLPPNPSELLASSTMELLIKGLEERYDYVIFDTPPLGIVSDALSFAQKTAGVVFVARYGKTTKNQLAQSLALIRSSGAGILGGILNGSKSAGKDYHYSKYDRYGYAEYR